jgi:hypothetical protein
MWPELLDVLKTNVQRNHLQDTCEVLYATNVQHTSAPFTLFRLYPGSIKALFRLYSGSIQALFRLYSGSIQALFRLYSGSIQALFRLLG